MLPIFLALFSSLFPQSLSQCQQNAQDPNCMDCIEINYYCGSKVVNSSYQCVAITGTNTFCTSLKDFAFPARICINTPNNTTEVRAGSLASEEGWNQYKVKCKEDNVCCEDKAICKDLNKLCYCNSIFIACETIEPIEEVVLKAKPGLQMCYDDCKECSSSNYCKNAGNVADVCDTSECCLLTERDKYEKEDEYIALYIGMGAGSACFVIFHCLCVLCCFVAMCVACRKKNSKEKLLEGWDSIKSKYSLRQEETLKQHYNTVGQQLRDICDSIKSEFHRRK